MEETNTLAATERPAWRPLTPRLSSRLGTCSATGPSWGWHHSEGGEHGIQSDRPGETQLQVSEAPPVFTHTGVPMQILGAGGSEGRRELARPGAACQTKGLRERSQRVRRVQGGGWAPLRATQIVASPGCPVCVDRREESRTRAGWAGGEADSAWEGGSGDHPTEGR